MADGRLWKSMFLIKAVWNWSASVVFHFFDAPLREYLRVDAPADPVYRDLFLSSAIVFGIGFWWVGQDPPRHLDIIRLGVLAQLAVFLLSACYLATGEIHPLQAIPGIVDLAFAILFTLYLARR